MRIHYNRPQSGSYVCRKLGRIVAPLLKSLSCRSFEKQKEKYFLFLKNASQIANWAGLAKFPSMEGYAFWGGGWF